MNTGIISTDPGDSTQCPASAQPPSSCGTPGQRVFPNVVQCFNRMFKIVKIELVTPSLIISPLVMAVWEC